MPGSETTELRIFCTCGQKMKVSTDMFGRPGKCIACRQKIRIPTPDQLPPNTIDVYLKDHPEFLRVAARATKSRPATRRDSGSGRPQPRKSPAADKRTVPLDVLEPLQTLCSLTADLEGKAQKEKNADGGPRDRSSDDLRRKRRAVHRALEDLREELRQRLMEVAIELTATQEKIAELNLSVRVGELEFTRYRSDVDRLRRRRDCLERRQQNLRGWIAVEDPFIAGGFRSVDGVAVPSGPFRVTFNTEEESKRTGLEGLIDGLREGLALRSQCERQVEDLARHRVQGGGDSRRIHDDESLAAATRERALAQIQYHRKRLDQRLNDYGSDLEAVTAQVDHARSRHQSGTLTSQRFNELEAELLRAKADLVKARDVIKRALAANSEYDVPSPRGTFFQRLAQFDGGVGLTAEKGLAWAAALAMFVSIVVPITVEATPATALQVYHTSSTWAIWLLLVPVVGSAVAAGTAMVRSPSTRALLSGIASLVLMVLFIGFFHESAYSESRLAEGIRSSGPWLLRPACLVFAVGLGLLGLASAVSFARIPSMRLAIPGLAAIAVVLAIAISTDLFGYRKSRPELLPSRKEAVAGHVERQQSVTVSLLNRGGRPMLLRAGSSLHNAYRFMLDRQVGADSWQSIPSPESIEVAGHAIRLAAGGVPELSVAPGEVAVFRFLLDPGTYRVQVQPMHGRETIEEEIVVTEIAPAIQTAAATIPQPEPNAEPDIIVTADDDIADDIEISIIGDEELVAMEIEDTESSTLSVRATAEVELRGVVASRGRDPVFSFDIHAVDGTSQNYKMMLGEEIYDGWKVAEFNPDEQTVTLANEISILILRRGQRYPLQSVLPR